MRKITMTLFAVMIMLSAIAQEGFTRQGAVVPKAPTTPVLDGMKDEAVYTGNGHAITRWNYFEGTGGIVPAAVIDSVEGVRSRFWFAHDDQFLYVFSTVQVPSDTIRVEIGVMVGLDREEKNYGWQGDPLGPDGFVFSKAVLGVDLQQDEIKKLRLFDYIYSPVAGGYEIEVRIPLNELSTDPQVIADFQERRVFYFDIGYKFSNQDSRYIAWSTNNNRTWRETLKTGIASLSLIRKEESIAKSATAPVLNAMKDAAYVSGPFVVENWTTRGAASAWMMPNPIEGAQSEFWLTYTNEALFVYGTVDYPSDTMSVELGILVSVDPQDVGPGWEPNPLNENGFLFSKAVFKSEINPEEIKTLREFDYIFSDANVGQYEFEVRIPWNKLTTDAALLTALQERKTFFFDIGFKLNNTDNQYFAWSNNNNRTWRETHPAGIISIPEGVQIAGVNVNDLKETALRIFPNPARTTLHIQSERTSGIAEVYNVVGARVLVSDISSGVIDVSSLKEGVYIIRVNFDNGTSAVRKFMKNN
jgi:hypothetical protein